MNRHFILLFVFKLLNHSDEPPTLLGGGAQNLYWGGNAPFAPPLVTALHGRTFYWWLYWLNIHRVSVTYNLGGGTNKIFKNFFVEI